MKRTALLLLALLLLVPARASAEAEPPAGSKRGRIPIWGVGLSGGVGLLKYAYSYPLASSGELRESSSSKVVLELGAAATLHLDLGNVVLIGAGSFSAVKPRLVEGSAGAIVGFRRWNEYAELIDSVRSGSMVTNTYKVYSNLWVPSVYGLYGGVGVLNVADSTDTNYLVNGDVLVKGGTAPTLEAGLGMAGRLSFILAGVREVSHGLWGGRMRMRAVFGGSNIAFHMGLNFIGMVASATDGVPILQSTLDFGIGDGPGVL